MLSLHFSPHTGFLIRKTLISHPIIYPLQRISFFFSRRNPGNNSFSTATSSFKETHKEKSPLSGLEDALLGYISGKKKATELAHMVWQRIARKGDHVVDATCGNGYDTLALLKMVADESGMGHVYGLDIQDCALKSTSSLLDESVEPNKKDTCGFEIDKLVSEYRKSLCTNQAYSTSTEPSKFWRRLVELFPLCHSKMEDIIPKGVFMRLIVFNLGYLPGGDKTIITVPEKTSQALKAACRILESGGLISMIVYVGHPGGREEYRTIQDFASGLPSENWVCCKFEMVNRPMAPVLVFLFKK